MRSVKRTLVAALLTSILTTAVSLSGVAWAAPRATLIPAADVFADVHGSETARAFAVLAALGVYEGDEGLGGQARPTEPISRAEMAAVTVRLMGRDSVAEVMSRIQPPYDDKESVPEWARGAVNVALAGGIMGGYPDNSFRPMRSITQAEAVAVLARAAGFSEAPAGDWPTNYVKFAEQKGLADQETINPDGKASRNLVALISYRALFLDPPSEQALFVRLGGVQGQVARVDDDAIELRNRGDDQALGGAVAGPLTTVQPNGNRFPLSAQVVGVGFAEWNELVPGQQVRLYIQSGKVVAVERVR